MRTFLTGCTHFGHKNIIKLADRPFKNLTDMDETLISNWNERVGHNDTVYHLGDFAYRGAPGREYLAKLNGRIILLQGNHDPKDWGTDYLVLKANDTKCILFHYPIEEWDGWYRQTLHFHCHTHEKEFVSALRRGNVGVDATDYAPILLEEAIERLTVG